MANLDVYKFLLVSKHCFSKKFHILSFNPNLGGFLVICFAVEGGEGGGGGEGKNIAYFWTVNCNTCSFLGFTKITNLLHNFKILAI